MSELKINKNIVLPKIDSIKDENTKRIMQDILNTIQGLNQTVYNDLTYLDEKIADLEEV
ncbi:MAG: hypothetical protein MUP69_10245 [Candidatus Atribacteria bacterium]|nr:hypothetical protein [Candidatus Atribacteria bacterium]